MKISALITYLETLPAKSDGFCFAEWRTSGYRFIYPTEIRPYEHKTVTRYNKYEYIQVLVWDSLEAAVRPDYPISLEAFISYLQTLPADADFCLSEYRAGDRFYIFPGNVPRTGLIANHADPVVLYWDNCLADRLSERQLLIENGAPA